MGAACRTLAGQTLRYRIDATDENGAPIDPLTITALAVRDRGGAVPVVIDHPATGVYYVSFTPPAAGTYTVHVKGTSPDMVAEVSVTVGRAMIGPQAWTGSSGDLGVAAS